MDPYSTFDHSEGIFLERRMFWGTRYTDLQKIIQMVLSFSDALKRQRFLSRLDFTRDFPEEDRKEIYTCQWEHDGYIWSSDVYVNSFLNPRDDFKPWKEIVFKLPNDGYVYSERDLDTRTKLEPTALARVEATIKEKFSFLFPIEKCAFHAYEIYKDRFNISFEDNQNKRKLMFTFEYYLWVGEK